MLNNVKEKTCKFLERNRYAITYGIYCGGCVLAGYMLGRHVESRAIGTGLDTLVSANPNLVEEFIKAKRTLDGIDEGIKAL